MITHENLRKVISEADQNGVQSAAGLAQIIMRYLEPEEVSTLEVQMMGEAQKASEKSTCSRLNVGAVLYRSDHSRYLATGFNAAPNYSRCEHLTWNPGELVPVRIREACEEAAKANPDEDFNWGASTIHLNNGVMQFGGDAPGCTRTIHAETRAIGLCAALGISTEGARLAVTHQPCLNCAKEIIAAEIEHVIFAEPYRDPAGLELLQEVGIPVIHYRKVLS